MSAIKRIGITIGAILLAVLVLWAGTGSRIDFKLGTTPGNPGAGVVRLWANSGTGNLECLNSSGGSCLPSGSGTIASINSTPQTGLTVTNTTGPNTLIAVDTSVVAEMDQLQYFKQNVCPVSVAGTALTCSINGTISSYISAGNPIIVLLKMSNTLSAANYTLAVNGLSNLHLYMPDMVSTISTGAILNGGYYLAYYAGNGAGSGPCTGSTDCFILMTKSN